MTTLEQIIEATRAKQVRGDCWQGYCPNHDDRDPSLSITAKGDKILLYCHSCGRDGTPAIVAALGLTMRDLSLGNGNGHGKTSDVIEAVYNYTDPAGRLLYQVIRRSGKQFRQRRPRLQVIPFLSPRVKNQPTPCGRLGW